MEESICCFNTVKQHILSLTVKKRPGEKLFCSKVQNNSIHAKIFGIFLFYIASHHAYLCYGLDSGKVRVTHVPSPSMLVTVIQPLCCS